MYTRHIINNISRANQVNIRLRLIKSIISHVSQLKIILLLFFNNYNYRNNVFTNRIK